jgi:di/tricarboxylate transporter
MKKFIPIGLAVIVAIIGIVADRSAWLPQPIVITLVILTEAFIAFVAEWLPVEITAILVSVILMLCKLVEPDAGIAGFGNSATVTIMAMFILSAGIAKTGVIQKIRDALIKWGGKNINQQILVLGAIVGPITAFINNTAVVALLMPVIEDWGKKTNTSVSKLLMPLSYITVLGGMITLIGTSTNITASGVIKKLNIEGLSEFGLFQFTILGSITFAIGLLYLAFISPKIIPNRKPANSDLVSEDYNLKDYVTEVIIKPRSPLIGKTVNSSEIQRKLDLSILELIRDGAHFPQPLGDKSLMAGDILLISGSREELLKIKEEKGIDILADVQFQDEELEKELTSDQEKVAEILILSNSRLIGSTLKDMRFRQRYNATVLAIRRGEELIRSRLGQIPLMFGDLLLVQAPKQSFLGLQTTRELLVLEEQEIEAIRSNKAWIAITIGLAVVTVSAIFPSIKIHVTALAGVILMIVTGCLKPGEIYGAVRWDVIFLLAGLFPLGDAMDSSGTTEWMAKGLTDFAGGFSGYWLLTFFYIITSVLTEILSNNAAVILMIPIAVKVAMAVDLSPFAFALAVTFSASNSYLTPIGYQTNTMVYGPGGYKFLDFTKVGLPLNILLTFLTPALIMLIYGLS